MDLRGVSPQRHDEDWNLACPLVIQMPITCSLRLKHAIDRRLRLPFPRYVLLIASSSSLMRDRNFFLSSVFARRQQCWGHHSVSSCCAAKHLRYLCPRGREQIWTLPGPSMLRSSTDVIFIQVCATFIFNRRDTANINRRYCSGRSSIHRWRRNISPRRQ